MVSFNLPEAFDTHAKFILVLMCSYSILSVDMEGLQIFLCRST